MSKVLVTESYLTDIGNAIRNKNGSTIKYKPSEMAGAINDIPTQGSQDNTVINSILDRSISGNYVNDDLTEIGEYAFAFCKQLTSANFTKATKIGSNAFYNCTSLESLSLPEVKEVDSYALGSVPLKYISLPKVEVLGNDTDFYGVFSFSNNIKTINIPSTIKSIGKNSFNYTSITTINIDKPANSISGAPWGATGATVNWTGTM